MIIEYTVLYYNEFEECLWCKFLYRRDAEAFAAKMHGTVHVSYKLTLHAGD